MKDQNFLSTAKRFSSLIIFLLLLLQTQVIKAQFANGADVGWLSQMEYYKYVFKDDSGNQKNCLEILKEKGINALRFRVWVNPTGNFCGKRDVAYMAHRADSMGFKVMIDFHMSDTWADPGHQTKPTAWAKDSFSQLQTDVYNHVYGVLDTLKSIGVIPKWVQIGNETNDGMLWEDGRASTHMSNFAALINSGYKAAKDVDTSIQVIVHLSNTHDDAMYRWMFDGLKNNGAKWDIIGMSVYPTWANLSWAADDSLTLITMKDMIARYKTKVMVVETGYPYNQAATAKTFLLDLIAKTKSVGGLGVFYWEPECYNWQNYGLGAWDPATKQPTIALDAFLESSTSSVKQEEIITDYNLNVYPNPFNPNTTIDYEVPKASTVSIVIYDALGREITRLVDGYKNPGSYKVVWSAGNEPSGIYFCRMEAGNYLETKKIVLMK